MSERNERRKPRQLSPRMQRIDRACAKMNGALTAVAIALAILVTLTAAVRAPNLLASSALEQSGD
jgi:hypothetical protein